MRKLKSAIHTITVLTIAIAITGCSATRQTHIYRDLDPRPARNNACPLAFGGEFMEIPEDCEMIGDDYYGAADGGFTCNLSGARPAFTETACSAGATHVRIRIVSACYAVRAEFYDCSSTQVIPSGMRSNE